MTVPLVVGSGVAIISQIGFLKTVEECFDTISSNRGAIDKVLADVKALADHLYRIKYKQILGGKHGLAEALSGLSPRSSPLRAPVVGAGPSGGGDHRSWVFKPPAEDAISLRRLGLEASPFDQPAGEHGTPRKHKVTLHEAGERA